MSCLDELFGDVEYNTQALPDTQAELPDRESETEYSCRDTDAIKLRSTFPNHKYTTLREDLHPRD